MKKNNQSVQIFLSLIDTLEDFGINKSVVARAINEKPTTVNSWYSRKAGVKPKHNELIVKAFPVQLSQKAKELGIDVASQDKAYESESIELQELRKEVLRLNEKMVDITGEAKAELRTLSEELMSEIKDLKRIIAQK